MTQFGATTVSLRSRRRMLAGAIATALLAPSPAPAFFQQTKLEGTVGTDIGGVWLSEQQVLPEFRISYPKPAGGPAVPVSVGPVPAELEPFTGKNASGVAVTDCRGGVFCADNGLVVGDIVFRINGTDVTDVASFDKAVEKLPETVLLSVRRPALKMTTVRLIKIKYAAEGKETADGSALQEQLDVRVLDVKLPFDDDIETARQAHKLFPVSAAQREDLAKNWAKLPPADPLLLVKGSHRMVSKANFDESLESDKTLAAAKFALLMDMDGNPMHGGGKLVDIYGIESVSATSMEGTYVSVTIANAPFPINVEFKGRFVMTRLGPWSDLDDKLRAEEAGKKPAEDLSKYKTLPDVPESIKQADKPK